MINFLQLVKHILTLIFLARFSIEDIKKTEVSNLEIFLFFGISILFYIFQCLNNSSFETIFSPIIFLFFSSLLFFLGQWGAGDAFILTSLGLLFPSSFILSFFYFFVISVYGIIYSFLYSFIFSFLKGKKYIIYSLLPFFFLLLSFFSNSLFSFISFLFFLYSSLPLLIKVQKDFRRKIKIDKLKEGDVLSSFKFWIGITKKDILKLKRKGIKFIEVKEGVRFAPTFLIFFILFELSYMKVVIWMPPFLMLFLHALQNLF